MIQPAIWPLADGIQPLKVWKMVRYLWVDKRLSWDLLLTLSVLDLGLYSLDSKFKLYWRAGKGGNQWGGFVNEAGQNNPTYEYYPSRGDPIELNILGNATLPANLFPLTWLLPSGNVFIQTNWAAEIFDYKNNVEYTIGDIPHAVRTYPASGGTIMLPLTPDNQYTATILFCGGSDLEPDQWTQDWAIAAYPADSTCVNITPDVSPNWVDDDPIFQGRSMGNMIGLPDLKILMLNGANTGVAGYGYVSLNKC